MYKVSVLLQLLARRIESSGEKCDFKADPFLNETLDPTDPIRLNSLGARIQLFCHDENHPVYRWFLECLLYLSRKNGGSIPHSMSMFPPLNRILHAIVVLDEAKKQYPKSLLSQAIDYLYELIEKIEFNQDTQFILHKLGNNSLAYAKTLVHYIMETDKFLHSLPDNPLRTQTITEFNLFTDALFRAFHSTVTDNFYAPDQIGTYVETLEDQLRDLFYRYYKKRIFYDYDLTPGIIQGPGQDRIVNADLLSKNISTLVFTRIFLAGNDKIIDCRHFDKLKWMIAFQISTLLNTTQASHRKNYLGYWGLRDSKMVKCLEVFLEDMCKQGEINSSDITNLAQNNVLIPDEAEFIYYTEALRERSKYYDSAWEAKRVINI